MTLFPKQFDIALSDLKLGKHIFNYTIGNDFFDCLDFSDVKQGKAKMDLITGRNLVFTLRREKQLPSEAFSWAIKTT
jgi:hypothetical protein